MTTKYDDWDKAKRLANSAINKAAWYHMFNGRSRKDYPWGWYYDFINTVTLIEQEERGEFVSLTIRKDGYRFRATITMMSKGKKVYAQITAQTFYECLVAIGTNLKHKLFEWRYSSY